MVWLTTAALVAGCGTWATHFIAMLAFSNGLPTSYDAALTGLSVLVAIAGAGSGFRIATSSLPWRFWLAGAVLGASVGAMHFTGMAALRVPAYMRWDLGLVAASLLIGVTLGAAAVGTALGGSGRARLAVGAALLIGSICALHFTAMGALSLEPTPLLPAPTEQLASWWLAWSVAAAAAVILAAATAGLVFDHHLARRAAREAVRLRTLVDGTFEGIIIHVGGTILDLNDNFARLLGGERPSLIGRPVLDLIGPEWREQIKPYLGSARLVACDAEFIRLDGARVPVEIRARPIEYEGRPARVVAVRDVTERRAAEERIHHLAHHDALTGLPNRVLFRTYTKRALARARSGGLALLCLDLDRFKSVNDTLGHPVGDDLLCVVAERLRACVRGTDLVARLGGDEFAIVQEGGSQPGDATALARRLVETMSKPFEVRGHQIVIGASIGVMLNDRDTDDADALLKCADLALYRAKAEGRSTWRLFESEMDASMQARRQLELDLRQALGLQQFQVFYQPLIETVDATVKGFEALLRWNHPTRGVVSPALFIPVAEEIGLIGEIGAWVLRQACADVASWPGDLNVAVNLSPVQFRSRALAAEVARALSDSGLSPSRLELEVTESLLLADDPIVLELLHELRRLGVRIAMDDFGTGYSSLSYLRRFPFDKIKIDQSFVRGLSDQGDCAAIVRAVIGLGRSLGMAVNAEGVETDEQFATLRAEGCGEVQGYLFSKARPAAEIPDFLRTQYDSRDAGRREHEWRCREPVGAVLAAE